MEESLEDFSSSRSLEELVLEYQRWFCKGSAYLFTQAGAGTLGSMVSLRGLSWKFFLGLLDSKAKHELWKGRLRRLRMAYVNAIRRLHKAKVDKIFKYLKEVEIDRPGIGSLSSTGFDRTSMSTAPPFSEIQREATEELERKNKSVESSETSESGESAESISVSDFEQTSYELAILIRMDMNRLFPDDKRFFPNSVDPDNIRMRAEVERVLVCWMLHNPEMSYVQGMQEIAYAVWRVMFDTSIDSFEKVEEEQKEYTEQKGVLSWQEMKKLHYEVAYLCGRQFVEHDTYLIFDAIITRFRYFFQTVSLVNGKRIRTEDEELGIKKMSRRIHFELLPKEDPELGKHFDQCGIDPAYYLIRWLRLLFLREFGWKDCIVLWEFLWVYSTPDDYSVIESNGWKAYHQFPMDKRSRSHGFIDFQGTGNSDGTSEE
eukprot:TRINITY_DN7165_c0_g1_i2.p1 TRINITY_DN7165_c0_g1~~TRINITY_DN7165_c0_g1_i2.p1  ORF type:complete len:430 (+),score=91.80 TRINITY_DN7165_c0_g1_i2:207-1496(+)